MVRHPLQVLCWPHRHGLFGHPGRDGCSGEIRHRETSDSRAEIGDEYDPGVLGEPEVGRPPASESTRPTRPQSPSPASARESTLIATADLEIPVSLANAGRVLARPERTKLRTCPGDPWFTTGPKLGTLGEGGATATGRSSLPALMSR